MFNKNKIIVKYKYTVNMPDQYKQYNHFMDHILNKRIFDLYNGKYELLVSTEYKYKINNTLFYQFDLDFDGDNEKTIREIKKLCYEMIRNNVDKYFFIQYSGNGFHIKSFIAIQNFSYDKLKRLKYWTKFNTLDIPSSFRNNPSRSPWTYSMKNKVTMITFSIKDFIMMNFKILSKLKYKKPNSIIEKIDDYKKLLKNYLLPIYYISYDSFIANNIKQWLNYSK